MKLIDRLVAGLNPRAKLPRGFAFWSEKLQVMWLKQNQQPMPVAGSGRGKKAHS